jgi:hypothetical protein
VQRLGEQDTITARSVRCWGRSIPVRAARADPTRSVPSQRPSTRRDAGKQDEFTTAGDVLAATGAGARDDDATRGHAWRRPRDGPLAAASEGHEFATDRTGHGHAVLQVTCLRVRCTRWHRAAGHGQGASVLL